MLCRLWLAWMTRLGSRDEDWSSFHEHAVAVQELLTMDLTLVPLVLVKEGELSVSDWVENLQASSCFSSTGESCWTLVVHLIQES